MRSIALCVILVGGCTTHVGSAGVIAPAPETVGVKLLRPQVTGRACRQSILWWHIGENTPPLRSALGNIMALDPEGTVVTDAEITEDRFVTGLLNRVCLEVRGNLGRPTPTLSLPGAADHTDHEDK